MGWLACYGLCRSSNIPWRVEPEAFLMADRLCDRSNVATYIPQVGVLLRFFFYGFCCHFIMIHRG